MGLDITELRAIAQQRDRYQTQLSRLKAAGKQTSCIEAAVASACETLSSKTTSFVIYGEPQSGKTEMMICLTARLLDDGHRIVVHLLNDSVQLLQQNLDRFQRSKLSPAARNFSEVIDPEYSLSTGYTVSELGNIRTESVGTECGDQDARENEGIRKIISDLRLTPKLSARHEAVLAHYVDDMMRAVGEAARVLSPGGKAVYVVGENTIRGTFIPNAKIVAAVAERSGLSIDQRRARTLPANRRYLPPPPAKHLTSASLDTRMRREVILSFSKP